MRYVGIDIAKKDHQIAAVDEFGNVILKSFSAGNNESGFARSPKNSRLPASSRMSVSSEWRRPATTGSRSGSSSTPTATRSWSSTLSRPTHSAKSTRSAKRKPTHRQRAHRRVPALCEPRAVQDGQSGRRATPRTGTLQELSRRAGDPA